MLNIHELEKRWLRYKIKSYLPYITITLSVSIIIAVVTLFIKDTKKEVICKVIAKAKPQQKIITPINSKKIDSKSNDKTELLLSPSLGFMKKMQTEIQPYYNKSTNSHSLKKREMSKPLNLQTESKRAIKEDKPKHITIRTESSASDIKKIIQRFKKTNNQALSLFAAKKYYKLGKYREARNYALITNNINQNIESSWLIFSKSLVKLGEKKKAINTLEKYIAHTHSHTAAILLDEIRSGKFR